MATEGVAPVAVVSLTPSVLDAFSLKNANTTARGRLPKIDVG